MQEILHQTIFPKNKYELIIKNIPDVAYKNKYNQLFFDYLNGLNKGKELVPAKTKNITKNINIKKVTSNKDYILGIKKRTHWLTLYNNIFHCEDNNDSIINNYIMKKAKIMYEVLKKQSLVKNTNTQSEVSKFIREAIYFLNKFHNTHIKRSIDFITRGFVHHIKNINTKKSSVILNSLALEIKKADFKAGGEGDFEDTETLLALKSEFVNFR